MYKNDNIQWVYAHTKATYIHTYDYRHDNFSLFVQLYMFQFHHIYFISIIEQNNFISEYDTITEKLQRDFIDKKVELYICIAENKRTCRLKTT